MIFLKGTTDKLQISMAAASTILVHVSWIDNLAGAVTPDRTNTTITTATTVDIVGAPAAGTIRNIKSMIVRNADPSASNSITVQHTDGTTVVPYRFTLLVGETMVYNEKDGFTVMDSGGGRKIASVSGQMFGTQNITAGTTLTVGPRTNSIFVRGVGGGGGGGGCTSVASAASAAGGGGAGAYFEKLFAVVPNTTYTIAIGAAGAAVSGAAGGNGGSTTITVGGLTVTAPGGTGGPVAVANATPPVAFAGGAGGAIATNGDLNSNGDPGKPGFISAVTPIGFSGAGGSSEFGGGGVGIVAAGNGNNGLGHGSGGGGSMTGASVARSGGAGTGGMIIVQEFS